MPLDPCLCGLMVQDGIQHFRISQRLTEMADRNLVQGLGVVNTTVIQSAASNVDDAALFAALQTANQVPGAGRGTPT